MKTKDQLQSTVDGLQEALAKAQSDLAALDKPELRHGDVRGDTIYLEVARWCRGRGKLNHDDMIANKDGLFLMLDGKKEKAGVPVDFNLFADLAAQAEPLEEFEVKRDFHNIFKAYHGDWFGSTMKAGILIKAINDKKTTTLLFTPDQATEIHKNLGRLIATAKRKAAAK